MAQTLESKDAQKMFHSHSRDLGWWEKEMIQGNFPVWVVAELQCEQLDMELLRLAVNCSQLRFPMMGVNVDVSNYTFYPISGLVPFKSSVVDTLTEFEKHCEKRVNTLLTPYGSNHPMWEVDVVTEKGSRLTKLCVGFSHAVGDGTSGTIVINEIIAQYVELSNLKATGKPLDKHMDEIKMDPFPPEVEVAAFGGSVGNITLTDEHKKNAKKLAERIRNLKKYPKMGHAPFPPPMEAKFNKIPNGVVMAKTEPTKFAAIKNRCKQMGITVGALVVGAMHFAVGKYIDEDKDKSLEFPWQFTHDLDANLRERVEPQLPFSTVACEIGICQVRVPIQSTNTKFWEHAKAIGEQMKHVVEVEREPVYYHPTNRVFGVGEEGDTAYQAPDMNLSNIGRYRFPGEYKCSEVAEGVIHINSIHTIGLYSPDIATYVFLTQTINDTMCYGWSHVATEGDRNTVLKVQKYFQWLVEHVSLSEQPTVPSDYTLKSFFELTL